MADIRAVILDIDGTILDTTEYIYQAYEHVLAHHKLTARSRAEIGSQIGKRIEDCYAFLAPGVDVKTLIASHDLFQSNNLALIKPFEGLDDLIRELRRHGLKVGLWTGRRHHLERSLRYGGVNPEDFDAIVDGGDTKQGKPDPEGLLLTAERIAVTPEHLIMIGDAAMDIEAGKRAKVAATIGVTHGFGSRDELKAADYLVDSLLELRETINSLVTT